jgi:hypothetical protein
MPNHVTNYCYFTSDDTDLLARMEAALAKCELFEMFIPCPIPRCELSHTYGHGLVDADAVRASNKRKYGYENALDWAKAKWGTKWDAYSSESRLHGVHFYAKFDTAWCSPDKVFAAMHAAGVRMFVISADEDNAAPIDVYCSLADGNLGCDSICFSYCRPPITREHVRAIAREVTTPPSWCDLGEFPRTAFPVTAGLVDAMHEAIKFEGPPDDLYAVSVWLEPYKGGKGK